MENNTFGCRLRDARKKMRMTQKQLAAAIGSKHNSVCNWEKGQNMPSPDTIVRICEVLNVTAEYMLPSKKETMVEPSTGLSEAAMRLAALYDTLDESGKELLNVVADLQVKRMKGMPKIKSVPHITGGHDSDVFAWYHAKREVEELEKEREETEEKPV